MVKLIQLLIFTFFFNGISQEVFISKNTCFKEINFDINVEQLTGFSKPEQASDGSYLAYKYLNEDGLRDCSELFGVWFQSFKIYKRPDNEIFFEFVKLFDSHSYMINGDALLDYFEGELTRLFGEVQIIEPTIENEINSKVWRWENDDVFYELRTWENDDENDIYDFSAIDIYIGKVGTL